MAATHRPEDAAGGVTGNEDAIVIISTPRELHRLAGKNLGIKPMVHVNRQFSAFAATAAGLAAAP